MKFWLRHLLIILLCTALFTGFAAKAQASKERDMPRRMRGYWAMPDCGTYSQALIITRHFYLQTGHKGSQLRPIGPIAKRKDYWVIPVAGVVRPVKVTADGQLTIGILAGPNPARWPHRWRDLLLNDRQEYMACAEIPTILPPPLVSAMKHIDRIDDACRADMGSACRHALFDTADKNKNGKISPQEMESAAVDLGGVALLAKHRVVSGPMLDQANDDDMRAADRLAKRFMPNGRGMSYAEFSGFVAKAQSQRLDDALADIGTLIQGFRP